MENLRTLQYHGPYAKALWKQDGWGVVAHDPSRRHPCGGQLSDGRRGPELIFSLAPWSLEGASYTLVLKAVTPISVRLRCSNSYRRERAPDSLCSYMYD